ncbi:GNAT family N-acetyltransferase [Paenibacillus sediminis]|uniref:N-acetylglutamate synthase-like GNAT family acetyltransferase n=1 Tax=Paenibacillus sediminis TaxID=664909 RepID=A0ABS4H271_9BACL|nr:GNAT family N-acetyltransferase [Paenibacillus sediminis]MBP1936561.1 N-acetylglutamate synthase-like GNAT family acetyltransferase [Paenibacillus sediminis]
MLQVDIIRPSIKDIKELSDFFRIVIIDTFVKEGIGEKLDDIEDEINTKEIHLKSDLESNGKDHFFLIAVYKGTIIGSIEIGPVNEIIRNYTNYDSKDLIELGTVFVHPNYQGKGVGNTLLKTMYCTMHQKGMKEFVLDSGYKSAQKIWREKFGEPNYLLKDYWDKGYDHMIWKIKISDVLNSL